MRAEYSELTQALTIQDNLLAKHGNISHSPLPPRGIWGACDILNILNIKMVVHEVRRWYVFGGKLGMVFDGRRGQRTTRTQMRLGEL